MKKLLSALVLCHLTFVITAMAVALPQYINYQGVLRDNAGNLVTGKKQITVNIYDAATGGTSLWNMVSPEVNVNNGLYSMKLGPLDSTALGGSGSHWLELTIATDVLSPRLEILGVAYALMAASAESASQVGGYSVAVSGNGIIPVTDSSGKLNSSVIPNIGNADYATLSGSASSAAYVKGQVSAEASGSNYALYVNGGKLGISTGSNAIAGTSSVPFGLLGALVSCDKVTANSIILLTVGTGTTPIDNATDVGVKVSAVAAGISFTVKVLGGNNTTGNAIPFSYLVIN